MRRISILTLAILLTSVLISPASTAPSERWAVCGQWRRVPVPDPTAIGELNDVAVVSPEEAWAVGSLGAEETSASLVLHWTGMRWEEVAFPKVARLEAVAVVSPTEVWVVGARGKGMGSPSHPFAARWSGSVWRTVPIELPIRGSLEDVAVVPGTRHLWAAGSTSRGHGLALRWNGRRWIRVATDVRQGGLDGIVAFPHVVWAVGSAGQRMVALRWNGGRWRRFPGPPGRATSVDGVAPDSLWAAGAVPADRPGHSRPALFRWNGEGWRHAWVGAGLGRLNDVVVPAPGVPWAVGVRSGAPPHYPLVVRRHPSGWRASAIHDADGWLNAIDGTPHNLWTVHASMVDPRGSEPTYFDTYHRC